MTDEDQGQRFQALMQRAQDGDESAYRTLLEELTPIIRKIVFSQRRFLPPEDREELVQEILLSVHSVRTTYAPDRPFMPWLSAIIRNRLADRGRQDARRRQVTEVADDFYVTFPATTTNIPQEQAYGDPEALRQAITDLPQAQREAVELVKMKEMSLKEASQHTGTSVTALKVSVHRAMKTLRATLKKD